jgi:alpha-D-xyloside xylohydrolase
MIAREDERLVAFDVVDGDLLRVRIGPHPSSEPDGRAQVVSAASEVISVAPGNYTTSSGYRVRVEPTGSMAVTDAAGNAVFATAPTPLGVSNDEIRFRIAYAPDERVYGLGQASMQRLDLRGVERRIWHEVRSGRFPCITGIPFMLSSRGYGLLLNTAYPSRFVVGDAQLAPAPIIEKQARFAPAPWPLDAPSGEEAADRITIIADCGSIEIYIILAPSPKSILARHASLTGLPALLPDWAFGYIQSRNRYRNQAELLALAKEFRRRRVPCDVLVIDWYWFPEFGDFDWDPANWPDARGMLRELRSLGFKVMISLHPYVDRRSKNWDRFAAAGLLIEYPPETRAVTAHDGLIDVTHPAGESLLKHVAGRLSEDGCAAWWVDQTQPEVHPQGTAHHAGSRESVHNLYPDRFARALHDGQLETNHTRVLTLSFAAYAGSPRHGVVTWTGDVDPTWEVLADQVVIGQQLSLSGLPYWTTDMGGYVHYEHYDPELFIRWMQWGVFCPLFRTHTKRPEAEPWSFGDTVLETVRTTLSLRYALIPYLVQLMHEAAATGVPLVRPLWLEFPEDPECIGRDHQFMLGDAILVAPVLEAGSRVRQVYLPPGEWFDGWTGEHLGGAREISAFAPLERIPYFIRAGAIVPFLEFGREWIEPSSPDCPLRLFPGPPMSRTLVFDDGVSYADGRAPSASVTVEHDGGLQRLAITVADAGDPRSLPSRLTLLVEAQSGPMSARLIPAEAVHLAVDSTYEPERRALRLTIAPLLPGDAFEIALEKERAQ